MGVLLMERLKYIKNLRYHVRLVSESGMGISAAMNQGVRESRGSIICHLHSDDYFAHTHVLSRVKQHLDAVKEMWLFGRILSDIDGALVPEQYRVPEYSYQQLLRGNFIPHPATFIRREVFERYGEFRTDLKFAMDYEFFLRIAKSCEPLALREVLAVFRRHEGSTTQRNRLASFEEDHRVRMSFAGTEMVSRQMHRLRYLVRRRRLLAQLT